MSFWLIIYNRRNLYLKPTFGVNDEVVARDLKSHELLPHHRTNRSHDEVAHDDYIVLQSVTC